MASAPSGWEYVRTWDRSTSLVKYLSSSGKASGIVNGAWYLEDMLACVDYSAKFDTAVAAVAGNNMQVLSELLEGPELGKPSLIE